MKTNYYNKTLFQKIKDYFDPRKVKIKYNYQKRAVAMSLIFLAAITAILIRYAWLTVLPTDLRSRLLAKGTKQL